MKIGSLFAGIGGLELGLEWAGVGETVFQVERDPFCRSVLERHWPHATRFDDVCSVGAHNLPAVDVLCGGFPCQDLSYAGKGAGLAGERSGLWFEFARLIGELRPRFVVVENVTALVTCGLDAVLGELAARGYDAIWFPLRASDVGAPHRRERVFIIGWSQYRGGVADAGRERGESWRNPGNLAGAAGNAESIASKWKRRRDAAGDCVSGQLVHPDNARLEGRRVRHSERPDERTARAAGGKGLADGDRLRESQPQGRVSEERGRVVDDREAELADGDGTRWKERRRASEKRGGIAKSKDGGARQPQSELGRASYGLPRYVDRWPSRSGEPQADWEAPRVAQGIKNRAGRLEALGNAVVPQVAYVVGKVLLEIANAR